MRTEVPHWPPQRRLADYYEMSFHQTGVLSSLLHNHVLSAESTLPIAFVEVHTERNLTAFPKTKFCYDIWVDQVEKTST